VAVTPDRHLHRSFNAGGNSISPLQGLVGFGSQWQGRPALWERAKIGAGIVARILRGFANGGLSPTTPTPMGLGDFREGILCGSESPCPGLS